MGSKRWLLKQFLCKVVAIWPFLASPIPRGIVPILVVVRIRTLTCVPVVDRARNTVEAEENSSQPGEALQSLRLQDIRAGLRERLHLGRCEGTWSR